tara:strand:+ start:1254 stop:1775 length:522 start_codon:yes stop_codon:yes gene_type:complete
MPKIKTLFRAVALVLVVVTLLGAWDNSRGLAFVTVTPIEGTLEPKDLGLGDATLPDYKVRLEVAGSWVTIGTRQDTSAVGGLQFEVVERIDVKQITQIELTEVDKVNDDLLERSEVQGLEIRGQAFTFLLQDRFDSQVAITWLFKTPVGVLLILGAVIFVLLGAIRAGLENLD